MSDTSVQPESHNGSGVARMTREERQHSPMRLRGSEPAVPTIQFRPEAKEKFVKAAKRAGLLMIDAADLAAELLERATAGEKSETPAERIQRLAGRVGK